MSLTGGLIILGFIVFAVLMIVRILPTLLALPLMAAWCALVVRIPLAGYLNDILLAGSMKLSGAMTVVIFGSMFARVIMKTGISSTIIKKAAELAGDQPRTIALAMTGATIFVFLGMSGLGAVIMAGSIAIPIMVSAGIAPLTACTLFLLGMQTGLMANAANYGAYIGIFGGVVTTSYYGPAFLISAAVSLIFVIYNVPRDSNERSSFSRVAFIRALCRGLIRMPLIFISSLGKFLIQQTKHQKPGLIKKRQDISAAALLAPLIPLLTVYGFKFTVGFGKTADGMVDPIAASIGGFILASAYAIGLTCPERFVNILAGSLVEGMKDIAGVLFLFMGIGMLVAAVINPAVAAVLNPLLTWLIPSAKPGVFLFFALLAPMALYRGPLNMFGMGAGIAALLASLHMLPLAVIAGIFLSVQYIQTSSDPTNSHNTWIGGFAGVDTLDILKKSLPYTWTMCILMLLYVILIRW